MMPTPPIQAVNWRHIAIDLDSPSTSVSTLAPVVENPDIDSNMASTGLDELRLVEQVWQRAEGCDQQPDERDHDVALARADALPAARHALEPESEARRDGARDQERPQRLSVAGRDRRGEEEGGAEVGDERADEVQRAADVHAERAKERR